MTNKVALRKCMNVCEYCVYVIEPRLKLAVSISGLKDKNAKLSR